MNLISWLVPRSWLVGISIFNLIYSVYHCDQNKVQATKKIIIPESHLAAHRKAERMWTNKHTTIKFSANFDTITHSHFSILIENINTLFTLFGLNSQFKYFLWWTKTKLKLDESMQAIAQRDRICNATKITRIYYCQNFELLSVVNTIMFSQQN